MGSRITTKPGETLLPGKKKRCRRYRGNNYFYFYFPLPIITFVVDHTVVKPRSNCATKEILDDGAPPPRDSRVRRPFMAAIILFLFFLRQDRPVIVPRHDIVQESAGTLNVAYRQRTANAR